MDNAIYATLTRQSGLKAELGVIANNVANVGTDGYRREGVVFAEHVRALENSDTSLSMGRAEGRLLDRSQGQLNPTGGTFDFAIEGDGYFLLDTPQGQHLTRAGAFAPGPEGELVNAEGYALLDVGGAPLFIPPDATAVKVSGDGTLSIDGRAIGQIGVYQPEDPSTLTRAGDNRFAVEGEIVPQETWSLAQGFLEASNVEAVVEIARMIEVQRAYEQGGQFLAAENERIRNVIETLG